MWRRSAETRGGLGPQYSPDVLGGHEGLSSHVFHGSQGRPVVPCGRFCTVNRRRFVVILDDGDTSHAGKWAVVSITTGRLHGSFPSEREAKAYRDYLNLLWN